MPSSRGKLAAWPVLLMLVSPPVAAQEDASQQALARAQTLLRQVSAQKQQLETANARLSAEVDALQTKLTGAEARLKDTALNLESEQRKATRTTGVLESTQERLTRTEGTLREAIERLRSANTDLQQARREGAELTARLAQAESELADSERKNLQLYQANVELTEMYRNKGVWAAMLQREPTGLKNVEIENVLQEYRLKLEDSLTDSNRDAARNATAAPQVE
jgi:chromosome segregation ATPase